MTTHLNKKNTSYPKGRFSISPFLSVLMALTAMLVLPLHSSNSLADEQKIEIRSLLANRVPVMLQFGKSWCPLCQSTKPMLDSAARVYKGQALVVPVDVEMNMQLVRDFRIRLIPTQVFLTPDGNEFMRHEGILHAQQIADIFSKMGLPRIEVQ